MPLIVWMCQKIHEENLFLSKIAEILKPCHNDRFLERIHVFRVSIPSFRCIKLPDRDDGCWKKYPLVEGRKRGKGTLRTSLSFILQQIRVSC